MDTVLDIGVYGEYTVTTYTLGVNARDKHLYINYTKLQQDHISAA